MEEMEDPTESIQEEIHHHAHGSPEKWVSRVALTSALLAVLAAVTSLLSGHHANEAMVDQIQASDQWNYYQAKGMKASILSSKMDLLAAFGKKPSEKDEGKTEQYKHDQEQISEKAEAKEKSSENHFNVHSIFARGVTLFQVAIGIAAIAILMRRKSFWLVSLVFGLGGVVFLIQGLMTH